MCETDNFFHISVSKMFQYCISLKAGKLVNQALLRCSDKSEPPAKTNTWYFKK